MATNLDAEIPGLKIKTGFMDTTHAMKRFVLGSEESC